MTKIIFDLTTRLPGPLATSSLQQFDYQVFKFENRTDPFKNSQLLCFSTWYQSINKGKEIISGDLQQLIDKHRPSIILSNSEPEDSYEKNWLVIKGNSQGTPLHDLNFWSQLGFIKDTTLPFLPFAGILFSQIICSHILSLQNKKNEIKTIYLSESVNQLLKPFLQTNEQTLHQGKYPCYQIYQLSDGLISVACVEAKFWISFCQLFDFPFRKDDAFDTTKQVMAKLKSLFAKITVSQAKEALADQQICVTLIL